MLNTSPQNSVSDRIDTEKYTAFPSIARIRGGVLLARILFVIAGMVFIIMFLPWTQTIQGQGQVTSLLPQHRPQKVPSVISGKIEEWMVREGDTVAPGDTIVKLNEVKDQYFDSNLIQRTRNRLASKRQAIKNYENKVENLNKQIEAIRNTRDQKVKQLENKANQAQLQIQSDSMSLQAAKNDLAIAENQLNRFEDLNEKGLKSLSALQDKQLKYRAELAKKVAAENKLMASRNELMNVIIEQRNVQNEYQDKISKAESDLNSAEAQLNSANADINKLENELQNYTERAGFRYVQAPQAGWITKIARAGKGEILKEGETVVRIMPKDFQLAVELYIRPNDFPLLNTGEKALLQFDGWPSIIFSGWPNLSKGTFEGRIYAIDNFISKNGKFRIMIAPTKETDWPDPIRAGSGATGMIMLKNVPVWYEIWRQINGFPPDFYQPEQQKNQKSRKSPGFSS